MDRQDPHFGVRPQRPEPKAPGRPSSSHHKKPSHSQQEAAEAYAWRGVHRAYQESMAGAKKADQFVIKKDQLEDYHKKWQDYWHQYYHRYYSDYYGKYYGEVKDGLEQFHQDSTARLMEMFEDNKKLAEEKQRLEDPEAIRRDLLNRIVERGKTSSFWGKARHHVRALVLAGTAAMLFLFIQFNPVVVGAVKQYLGPASSANLPTIVEPSSAVQVGDEPIITIPKIGVKVPVVYDEPSPENEPVQVALERGVVRYWNTASPGEKGNVVVLGHSSNNLLNSGNYKYAFVNLRRLEPDDVVYMDYEGVRYAYKVTDKAIVPPTEFSHVYQTEVPSLTLITCDPPGTDVNRLYVRAIQISPDPDKNKEAENSAQQQESDAASRVPSAAPSFWDSIF